MCSSSTLAHLDANTVPWLKFEIWNRANSIARHRWLSLCALLSDSRVMDDAPMRPLSGCADSACSLRHASTRPAMLRLHACCCRRLKVASSDASSDSTRLDDVSSCRRSGARLRESFPFSADFFPFDFVFFARHGSSDRFFSAPRSSLSPSPGTRGRVSRGAPQSGTDMPSDLSDADKSIVVEGRLRDVDERSASGDGASRELGVRRGWGSYGTGLRRSFRPRRNAFAFFRMYSCSWPCDLIKFQ
mmetsp:Transcript_3179/g.7735  ORF Transcript_3179/g.7735 Transcript_3179/m.7735 type:complete len:245 (+) Transcript_3179:165-899(+)